MLIVVVHRAPVLPVSVVAAFALGVLTAFAQGWLPEGVGSLANSSGSWVLVAVALALLAPTAELAAITGACALLMLLVGYVVGAGLKGFTSGTTLVAFWGLAGVLAGPPLGLAAHAIRRGPPMPAALGAAAVAGVLIGEAIHGLTRLGQPVYWAIEGALGIAIVFATAERHRLTTTEAVTAAAATAAVAAAFVAIYGADLIALV